MEQLLRRHPGCASKQLLGRDVDAYLTDLGCGGLPEWQLRQTVDAIHRFGMATDASWVSDVDWRAWRERFRDAVIDPQVIARGVLPPPGALRTLVERLRCAGIAIAQAVNHTATAVGGLPVPEAPPLIVRLGQTAHEDHAVVAETSSQHRYLGCQTEGIGQIDDLLPGMESIGLRRTKQQIADQRLTTGTIDIAEHVERPHAQATGLAHRDCVTGDRRDWGHVTGDRHASVRETSLVALTPTYRSRRALLTHPALASGPHPVPSSRPDVRLSPDPPPRSRSPDPAVDTCPALNSNADMAVIAAQL